ncbi:Acg family FMN-binding oxidoreductase [Mycobacterium sherrisii]|uniref:NAD(P)H nitroreductase n=1 Tax=Mycobacterium sherrisii TaxID=243061 RepID=A0A1E3SPV7_9MYCO|nr:nitroreductase family protein [Mycobacterium sherrisii]MCV7031079.1 nitroreductase family protein [Mycobacterium sherrisii]ODR03548.1 NAD(P)H nitroreductase [Mycobacterium sherrisii]ORW72037.1 NAD(P)H nitroreductase [Mycobacterium sherrisii]
MQAPPDIRVLKTALRTAVQLACRAPSVHNSQPWRWVAEGPLVHLFIDRHRTVPGTDWLDRDAIISCGAVLDHLRVAMLAAGWQADIKRFPRGDDPDKLASLEFSLVANVTPTQRARALAILQRRTDRLPLQRPTYWDLFERTLYDAVDGKWAKLLVLGDDSRRQLAQAAALTEDIRSDDWLYRAELDWWTTPYAVSEGIPPTALASESEQRRVDIGREFPVRIHTDRRHGLEADRSKVLVLYTDEDTRADWLRCGEVLSTVLLECTMAGLATCPLTHLIELDEGRDVVRDLIDRAGEPQILVRVGMAPPIGDLPAPTPRRPLPEVFTVR